MERCVKVWLRSTANSGKEDLQLGESGEIISKGEGWGRGLGIEIAICRGGHTHACNVFQMTL